MKSLSSIVNESIANAVLESFGSEKISAAFRNIKCKYKDVMRSIAWDKVTDDDYEVLTAEEARKLAYRRDSGDVLVWFIGSPGNEITENDKPVCVTTGNYMIHFFNWELHNGFGTGRGGRHHTVKNISDGCTKAIRFFKQEEFMTRDLRQARLEAKQNATALMSERAAAEKNQERYREILAKKRLDRDANQAAVDAKIEEVTKEYTDFIQEIAGEEAITSDAIWAIKTVNSRYSKVLDCLDTVVKYYLERESQGWDAEYAHRGLVAAEKEIKVLKDYISMFRKDLKDAQKTILGGWYKNY